MKVRIKKDENVKAYKLISSWEDVTLEKWARLVDLENGSKSTEAIETVKALSNIPKKIIKELGVQDVAVIMSQIAELQSKSDDKLKRVIKLEDKEYGFHPNLEDITLGEWADLEHFIDEGFEKKLPEIMAILYRPITEKENDVYTIAAYDGNIKIRAEKIKQMSASAVQSALVFFWSFVSASLQILPSSLMERLEVIQETLEKNSQLNGVTSE